MRFFSKHARLRDQLSPYIDGALSSSEQASLERHLETCEACRVELDELRSTIAATRELPHVEAPRSFALTPQMLEEAPRLAAPAPSAAPLAFGMRLASSGVAVVLAVVVIGDLSDAGGGGTRETGNESADLSRTGQFSAIEGDQSGGGEVAPAPDTTESAGQSEAQPPAEDAATADRSGTATCPPGVAVVPTEATAGGGAGGSAGGGGAASAPPATPIPQPSATPTPAPIAQSGTTCVEQPLAAAVAPTAAVPEPEAADDTSAEGLAASGAVQQSEDDGGVSTLRILELVLAAALIVLLGCTITELALRRRRAA